MEKKFKKLLSVGEQIHYDYGFSISNDALDFLEGKIEIRNTDKTILLYCSELAWVIGVRDGNEFSLRKIQGKDVFEPDDVEAISKIII